MEIKLPYGLKNDNLISIDEVSNGLACECFCPFCKGQLIARKGNIKVHHFAHYQVLDCGKGLETALHKICKDLFLNSKFFVTPALLYPGTDIEIFEEQTIPIDSVRIQQKIGDIIPDIIIESKGKLLLVEIAVSHSIDYTKKEKIKSMGLATIEIQAKYLLENRYYKKDFGVDSSSQFSDDLITGTKYKRWVFNPKLTKVKKALEDNYTEKKAVKSFKINDNFDYYDEYYYYVDDCPLDKKKWSSGFKKGKSYASYEDNCSSCIYCVSKKSYNEIQCIGYLKKDFPKLIKELK